jgi:hypothetical protein
MRYTHIRPRSCPVCFPSLAEDAATHNLQFNRQTFYNNMRLLIQSGRTSDLEGVDTLVRLGYLEKMDSDTIFQRFEMEHPIAGARNRGSYNSADDRLRMAYDVLFEPGGVGSGTSTLAHELRHRAFYIISVTPELEARMPGELRGRWRDGYGVHQVGVDRWRYEGGFASPEHAMIYAVQYADPLSEPGRARFFLNPELGGRSVQYWRDLYRSVENSVRLWFADRVPALAADPSAGETVPEFELTAQQRAFYHSLSTIHGLERERLSLLLQEIHGRFVVVALDNKKNSAGALALQIATNLYDNNYEVLPQLIAEYQRAAPQLSGEDAARIQVLLAEFERTGISWRLLDQDTFTPAEFQSLVQLRPDLVPAVPVTRAPPVSAVSPPAPQRGAAAASTAPEPPAEPVVVPRGGRIGLYQWAVSNSIGSQNLWDLITSSVSTNTLRTNMSGLFAVQLDRAGLRFTPEAQAQLDALYTMLAAGGYDSTVVIQMLARMELVRG